MSTDRLVQAQGPAGAPRLDGSTDRKREQLHAIAAELLARREPILEAWRAAGVPAAERGVAASLSRAQFNDHIPAVLDSLAHTIEAWPNEQSAAAEQIQSASVSDHGLQRWQQGYQLRELVREWGHLQLCVADELERYATSHPELEPGVMAIVRHAWTELCAEGITDSATQYWRLHQAESAGHVTDLEKALSALKTLEQARAETWRTAAHDLRGSVTFVKGASTLLQDVSPELSEPVRSEIAEMLGKSVASLNEMLTDLLSLARLEAGHEQRELTTFDAGSLLSDFCEASQSAAVDRGLFLKMEGPRTLPVQGDKAKVRRILQNLLLNAIKYTAEGGITVTWGLDRGRDTDRWTFSVQDTGPGIDMNSAAPLAQELHDATTAADEAMEASTDRRRDIEPARALPSESPDLASSHQPGEGVGLSIVKRLCELLDAGLELVTEPGHGSTFRVILPRCYDSDPV